jgi:hypothetical protein
MLDRAPLDERNVVLDGLGAATREKCDDGGEERENPGQHQQPPATRSASTHVLIDH